MKQEAGGMEQDVDGVGVGEVLGEGGVRRTPSCELTNQVKTLPSASFGMQSVIITFERQNINNRYIF